MERRLLKLEVENFRSLRKVSLPLGALNVLVGPNGAGKTTVLEVFQFLADIIRTDLEPALGEHSGFDGLVFRGGERAPATIRVGLVATWTTNSSIKAPDEYRLRITRASNGRLSRQEEFSFKRTRGRGRRITISGERADVTDADATGKSHGQEARVGIRRLSSGLSTLPRLSDDQGGGEVATLARHLESFRVFDVDVAFARRSSRYGRPFRLSDDASNLAAFLFMLSERFEQSWLRLVEDARAVLPQLEDIGFEFPSGAAREVVVTLVERGLRQPTPLADASYGTIRLLGLLALLYDPKPPAITCVEEIDHGLHPQALELIVDRLREASGTTQFIIATHSPALADRLRPEEIVVCERRDDGSSAIPAMSTSQVEHIVEASEGLPLGELWFSGALGGDL